MQELLSLEDRVARVAAKIKKRGFNVGPCIAEATLAEFEARYGISLPPDYREFILKIANSAPGPPAIHGLIELADPPLGEADSGSHTQEELASMRKIFPFTKPWIWEDGGQSQEGTREQVFDGQLYLGTEGCGMDWILIISGPDRGRIWLRTGEGIQPTDPKRDFLQWFEDWVDGVRDWWV